jgi:F-type H+-transporting ATPase subunit b
MNVNATLLGQMVTFGIFVWFTMTFVWPAIMQALDERERKIKSGLQAAEQGHIALKQSKEEGQQHIDQAKQQAAGVLDEAHKRAKRLEAETLSQAEHKRAEIVKKAMADIEQQKQVLLESLLASFSDYVIKASSQVLQAEVSASKHASLLKTLSQDAEKYFAGEKA